MERTAEPATMELDAGSPFLSPQAHVHSLKQSWKVEARPLEDPFPLQGGPGQLPYAFMIVGGPGRVGIPCSDCIHGVNQMVSRCVKLLPTKECL